MVINGAGSAGIAIAKLLLTYGFSHIIICDSKGIISRSADNLTPVKEEIAQITNKDDLKGTLADTEGRGHLYRCIRPGSSHSRHGRFHE